ncbi:30S ribosome-binding factor RbfA [Muricoccus radiodurans]|uniref:30S ribosome-binding factor RbfA n=1 Tax=Muricoccus radiodurans TaxID=2231721 RepID=UPI003CE9EE92
MSKKVLRKTGREGGEKREAPKRAARPSAANTAPSQRMLRVGEEIRHALSAVLTRGDVHDPELADARITVTEVRASPDLKHMTVFVSRLGATADKPLLDLLRRNQPELRRAVAGAVRLKFAPELHFQADTALDHAMHIDALMRRPEVARDLAARAEEDEEGEAP